MGKEHPLCFLPGILELDIQVVLNLLRCIDSTAILTLQANINIFFPVLKPPPPPRSPGNVCRRKIFKCGYLFCAVDFVGVLRCLLSPVLISTGQRQLGVSGGKLE